MIKPILAAIVAGALFGVSACSRPDPVSPSSEMRPRFGLAPGDGNGKKLVIPIDEQHPGFVTCASGATLDMHLVERL